MSCGRFKCCVLIGVKVFFVYKCLSSDLFMVLWIILSEIFVFKSMSWVIGLKV